VSLYIVLRRLQLILKLLRIHALEEYLNLHNKPKKVIAKNMLIINNMQLNVFIHESLLFCYRNLSIRKRLLKSLLQNCPVT